MPAVGPAVTPACAPTFVSVVFWKVRRQLRRQLFQQLRQQASRTFNNNCIDIIANSFTEKQIKLKSRITNIRDDNVQI
jgi:glucose-6-phosphate dehydrogenase assembly protein OpcA